MLKDKLRKNVKVYGPYIRKQDGRKHVIVYWFEEDKRQTVSYPKWLMEQKLDRFLTENETVDHIDRDFTNNDLDNLQILSRHEHAALDVIRRKTINVQCVECNTKFEIEGSTIYTRHKAGPFCSRQCSGKYGSDLQHGRATKLPKSNLKKEYYQRIK